jgi:hydroxyacylglutathione hydrolase
MVDPADQGRNLASWVSIHYPGHRIDVFLTHGHVDHTLGAIDFCKSLPNKCDIYASEKDLELFENENLNKSSLTGQSVSLKELRSRMVFVESDQILTFGDDKLKVLGLPGHTPGSIGLYSRSDNWVIVGDTLFRCAIGAAKGWKADFWSLLNSVKQKLLSLPDDTVVFPGHGEETTIGFERKHNPFLVRV